MIGIGVLTVSKIFIWFQGIMLLETAILLPTQIQ